MTAEKIAYDLLYPLFKGIDSSYKQKYKAEIWEHFENAVRSSGYTPTLVGFLSTIKQRLPISIQTEHIQSIKDVVESGEDDDVLDLLRNNTTYLVLLVRLKNQNNKNTIIANPINIDKDEDLNF